jgi:hypothetical protein
MFKMFFLAGGLRRRRAETTGALLHRPTMAETLEKIMNPEKTESELYWVGSSSLYL